MFNTTAMQLRDILEYMQALDGANELLDSEPFRDGKDLGGGHRAVLRGPIEVTSDAAGVVETLGWIVFSDFGTHFTQKKPE